MRQPAKPRIGEIGQHPAKYRRHIDSSGFGRGIASFLAPLPPNPFDIDGIRFYDEVVHSLIEAEGWAVEHFTLTRREAAGLLLSIQGKYEKTPLEVLQEAWLRTHRRHPGREASIEAFLETSLPAVCEKMMKKRLTGLSLNEIVMLGNQIEYSNLSVTSVQNWVKRDFKEFLGAPRVGKKYSIEQAAMLLIIEDLRSNLDFESIRKLFQILFQNPEDETDDLIVPAELYYAYSSLFEEMDENDDQMLDVRGHDKSLRNQDALIEQMVRTKTDAYVSQLHRLKAEQKEAVRNALVVALISVQTSYFQSLARRYVNATLFLHRLHT